MQFASSKKGQTQPELPGPVQVKLVENAMNWVGKPNSLDPTRNAQESNQTLNCLVRFSYRQKAGSAIAIPIHQKLHYFHLLSDSFIKTSQPFTEVSKRKKETNKRYIKQ